MVKTKNSITANVTSEMSSKIEFILNNIKNQQK